MVSELVRRLSHRSWLGRPVHLTGELEVTQATVTASLGGCDIGIGIGIGIGSSEGLIRSAESYGVTVDLRSDDTCLFTGPSIAAVEAVLAIL